MNRQYIYIYIYPSIILNYILFESEIDVNVNKYELFDGNSGAMIF